MAICIGIAACSQAPPKVVAPDPKPRGVTYDVSVVSEEPWVIDVRATFEGGVVRGAIGFPPAIVDIVVEQHGRSRTPEPHGRAFELSCKDTCTARYRFDLSRAAELTDDSAGVAVRSGGDVLAPASVWILRPEPADPRLSVKLRVEAASGSSQGGEPSRFVAPFPREAASGAYSLVARDLRALGYTLFGKPWTSALDVTKGSLDLAVMRGKKSLKDEAIERWVRATAKALDTVYGRFPSERALVVVVPVPGTSQIVFGRTVPAGGASIAIYVGEDAGEGELFGDWVLAHELVHLGVPSMPRDGRWLDEGLATYYEPILRARSGLYSEAAVWGEVRSNMPMGVATTAEPSLSHSEDHDRVYFGGSLFALACDVEIRRRTNGARSLDDGLRRALDEGATATEVWSVEKFIAALDRGSETTVAREYFDRVSTHSSPCELGATSPAEIEACAPDDAASMMRLFGALGVTSSFGVYDESAPLAEIRRTITRIDSGVAGVVLGLSRGDTSGSLGGRNNASVERP